MRIATSAVGARTKFAVVSLFVTLYATRCSSDGGGPAGAGGATSTGGASGATGGATGGSGGVRTDASSGGTAGNGGTGGTASGGTAGSGAGGASPRDAAPESGGSGGTGGAGGAAGSTRDASGGAPNDVASDTSSPRDVTNDAPRDAQADVMVDGSPRDATSDAFPPGGFNDARSTTHLDIGVHDPAVIWDGARYTLFATGGTLGIRNSNNLLQWSNAGNVFSAVPAWIKTALGSDPEGLWAPDIAFFNGKYHLYYAGSTFGSNHSVIGLATNVTLDRASASYAWVDEGVVIESVSSNNYNAIDPNIAFDETGAPWMSFGSFWDGIKMRKLDPATGKPSASDTTLYSLASRGGGAIEAPSIISNGGYYYLFVSFDACCKGTSSTYRSMVGRSTSITGPYVDRAGAQMMKGAAEELLKSTGRYIGPGGGMAYRDGSLFFYAYHYYDSQDGGKSKLSIRPISFDVDGWPKLEEQLWP
ncbi:MAG: arabinan endo-1,5-alpha-L-arabinosidase [Polyangiaceae bacterium]